MRTLPTLVLLLIAGSVSAQPQRSFVELGYGPSSRGLGVRVAVGIGGLPVTPVVRLAAGEGEFASEFTPGRRYRQDNREFGVGLMRLVKVTNRVSAGGGAGLALASANRYIVGEERSGPGFRFDGLGEFGLSVPVELTVVGRLTPTLSVSATGFRSFPLGTAMTQQNTPEAREQYNPDIDLRGVVIGLRLGR